MEFTGERMMPSHNRGNLIYGEHLVRYSFAAQFVKGKKVLDIATGVGYGAKLLRQEGAVYVCGVDKLILYFVCTIKTTKRFEQRPPYEVLNDSSIW